MSLDGGANNGRGNGDGGPLPYDLTGSDADSAVREHTNIVDRQHHHTAQLTAQAEAIGRIDTRTAELAEAVLAQGETLRKVERHLGELREDSFTDGAVIGNLASQQRRLTEELTVSKLQREWMVRALQKIGKAMAGVELEPAP